MTSKISKFNEILKIFMKLLLIFKTLQDNTFVWIIFDLMILVFPWQQPQLALGQVRRLAPCLAPPWLAAEPPLSSVRIFWLIII